jgi:hypothetical protein
VRVIDAAITLKVSAAADAIDDLICRSKREREKKEEITFL